jgi:hypothetical protein
VRIFWHAFLEISVVIDVVVSKWCLTWVALPKQFQVQYSKNLTGGMVAAGLMAHVDFGFLAVGASLGESNLKRRPSDMLVSLEDACIVDVAAVGFGTVDSPIFVTSIERFGQNSGM